MYTKPFHISGNTSNNAFSFDRRKNPRLYVPALKEDTLNDLELGNEVVFEDFDENGVLQSCTGLKHFLRTTWDQKPVVIVDNHNHVFYFWYEARQNGILQNGTTLVHIDQHRDERIPERWLPPVQTHSHASLPRIFDYTNTVLNVGNYIPPARQEGLVKDLISITSEAALRSNHLPNHLPHNLILNIDLDFWAPEMDYIDHDWRIARTREWMQKADFITIATSPFFIDQKRAIGVLNELMN